MRHALLMILLLANQASAVMNITRELEAPDNLVPGQPVRVAITFWTDSWFTPPPVWPQMEIENGALLNLNLPNQLLSRREGNTLLSGIKMERMVMAWDKGTLQFPAMTITLESGGQPPRTVTLPALATSVVWPANVQQPDRFLPASRLSLQQKWQLWRADGDKALHVGDVIERQVTLRARNVIPAQIPSLLFSIPGSGTQLLAPENSTLTSGRDEVEGAQRIERLRYLPDKPGQLTLPPVQLRWWDTTRQQWQLAHLPGKTFTVAPARATGSESALIAREPGRVWFIAGWVAVALFLALVAVCSRRLLWRALRFGYHRWLQLWRVVSLPELAPFKKRKT